MSTYLWDTTLDHRSSYSIHWVAETHGDKSESPATRNVILSSHQSSAAGTRRFVGQIGNLRADCQSAQPGEIRRFFLFQSQTVEVPT
jgi:hypothetical protein